MAGPALSGCTFYDLMSVHVLLRDKGRCGLGWNAKGDKAPLEWPRSEGGVRYKTFFVYLISFFPF